MAWIYCKFGIFHENFIFVNRIKRYICDVRNSQLVHDLPISVNDRVILPFREGFSAKFREIKTLTKIYSKWCIDRQTNEQNDRGNSLPTCVVC